MLNSITVDQMRTAIAALSSGPPTAVRNKEAAVEVLTSMGVDEATLVAKIYDIEAVAPADHVLLLPLHPETDTTEVWKKAQGAPQPGSLRLGHAGTVSGAHYLTYELDVESRDWVTKPDNPREKELKEHTLRMPIVVRFSDAHPLASISYPGIAQGSVPKEDRIRYESIATTVVLLLQTLGLKNLVFPVRKCINRLNEAETPRFVIVGTNSLTGRGKVTVSSAQNSIAIDEVLARLFLQDLGLDLQVVKKAVASAVRSASVSALVLFWRNEQVITRLDFWDVGAEFLFIWGDASRSYRIVEAIFDLLWSVTRDTAQDTAATVWNEITTKPEGDVILAADLCSRFALPVDVVRLIIRDAVLAGILEPVYQLHGAENVINGPSPTWTTKLTLLAREFRTTTGDVIDGRDPSQILVAFRRIKREELRQ